MQVFSLQAFSGRPVTLPDNYPQVSSDPISASGCCSQIDQLSFLVWPAIQKATNDYKNKIASFYNCLQQSTEFALGDKVMLHNSGTKKAPKHLGLSIVKKRNNAGANVLVRASPSLVEHLFKPPPVLDDYCEVEKLLDHAFNDCYYLVCWIDKMKMKTPGLLA
ncbi:hypothetical protein QOT17_006515 [Balamuthia mandrillaris]